MRRFRVLSWSLLIMTLRDRSTLFWGIAFPVGLTVLYGTISGHEQDGGAAAISWLATGVVALTIMASGLVGEAGHFTEMRERGTLQRVHATPLPPTMMNSRNRTGMTRPTNLSSIITPNCQAAMLSSLLSPCWRVAKR